MRTYLEKAREIPITHEVDVLVVGGGRAGIAGVRAGTRNRLGIE